MRFAAFILGRSIWINDFLHSRQIEVDNQVITWAVLVGAYFDRSGNLLRVLLACRLFLRFFLLKKVLFFQEFWSSDIIFFLSLLHFFMAARTIPFDFRNDTVSNALEMCNLVITMLTNYLVLFSIILPANETELSKLWSIIKSKRIWYLLLLLHRWFNLNSF